jgi:hypothetical protein
MEGLRWVADIRRSLPAQAFVEYFLVWDILQEVQLNPNVPDIIFIVGPRILLMQV